MQAIQNTFYMVFHIATLPYKYTYCHILHGGKQCFRKRKKFTQWRDCNTKEFLMSVQQTEETDEKNWEINAKIDLLQC